MRNRHRPVVLMSLLVWLGVSACFLPGCTSKKPGLSLGLIREAQTFIHDTDPQAQIVYVGAIEKGDSFGETNQTQEWMAMAVVVDMGKLTRVWLLSREAAGEQKWELEALNPGDWDLPLGATLTDLASVTMDITEAWQKALAAGLPTSDLYWPYWYLTSNTEWLPVCEEDLIVQHKPTFVFARGECDIEGRRRPQAVYVDAESGQVTMPGQIH